MSSSHRTYGRKRKDQAEEKFDALFSDEILKKPITIHVGQIKKSKKNNNETAGTGIKLKNGTEVKFNSVMPAIKSIPAKHDGVYLDRLSFSPKKVKQTKTYVINRNLKSDDTTMPFHSYKSISGTKYDMLFKKNEKNASDKFDALFGDELTQTEVKPEANSTKNYPVQVSKNPEYENLFGFADPPTIITQKSSIKSETDDLKTVFNLDKIPPLSSEKAPIKLTGITGASMRTVGGKVVLNIQKRTKSSRKQSLEQTNANDSSTDTIAVSKPLHTSDNFSTKNKTVSLFGSNKKTSLSSNAANFSQSSKPAKDIDAKLRSTEIFMKSAKSVPAVLSPHSVASRKRLLHQQKPYQYHRLAKRTQSPFKQNVTLKPSYNSRPWMQPCEERESQSDKDSFSLSQPDSYEFDSEEATPKLIRSVTWPEQIGESIKTSLKCDKSAKAYFTVVKHVKNYQNCLEEGETKEFEDEVNYLLEGLHSSQPLSVRCLSATNFASKCQQHNFRLFLRAHNIADKVFSHLADAKEHSALALSTAALLFMLSRDRQMEINKSTLQLLLRLLDPFDKDDPSSQSKHDVNRKEKDSDSKYKFFKSKDKAINHVDSMKANTESIEKIKHLITTSGDHLLSDADVSVKRLSSEALLRFTARRTVDWFREEIRIKGGLDHIISLVKFHVDKLDAMSNEQPQETEFKPKTTLCILERLLKVLENGIVNSPRNAMYLVTHQRALLLKKLARLMQLTKAWLPIAPPVSPNDETSTLPTYSVLHNSVVQTIKLLVNISNDNEWVSSRVGEQDGMLENIVDCILTTPASLQEEHRYELILLSLSLLVNLVESSAKNRIALMKMTLKDTNDKQETNVIGSLVRLFEQREAAAKENEVLGETGVRKAVAARKTNASNNNQADTTSASKLATNNDNEGHWVETEDGMEWVPSEDKDDVISASQDSCRTAASSKNPESTLTAEERNEMKETLDKANEHMEDSIVASYAALVLGCLIHGNRANSSVIRSHFSPSSGFPSMIRMLKKFLSFMSLTAGMSTKGEKTLTDIIEAVDEENENT